jgi:Glycosyl hydrolases family 18
MAKSAWPSFAPFVDAADYPAPDFGAIRSQGGVTHTTLGFVTASDGTDCVPTWGGYADYQASGPNPYLGKQVTQYRKGGGDVVVSFGGAAGTELASACGSVGALAKAYGKVISAYRAKYIDFDVEGATITDPAANTKRAKAIAKLQRAAKHRGRRLSVSYTLPVLPTGLDSDGRAVVEGAVQHHVAISIVNVMAMDYGAQAAPNPQGQMGDLAISAGRGLAEQLASIYPKLSAARVARMVGVTPMIGINDVETEVFTLADAAKLVDYARSAGIGMLSMWQLGRDSQCSQPTTTTQLDCSGIAQQPWDFSKSLGAY